MQIEIAAKNIATKYADQKIDMNESIAKIASENNLNLDQTCRLVEECNKNAYLQIFEKTGEQIFDIASLEKVRNYFNDNSKQVGSMPDKIASIDKNALNAYGIDLNFEKLVEKNTEDITKIASLNEDEINASYKKALMECDNKIGNSLTKMASIRKTAVRFRPSLEKIADFKELAFELSNQKTETFDQLAEDLTEQIEVHEKNAKIKKVLLEKKAGILSNVLSSATQAGGKLGGKLISTVVKNPGKSLTTAMVGGAAMHGFKEPMKDSAKLMGNVSIPKTASLMEEITSPSVLNFIKSNILPAAGIAVGVAGINAGVSGISNLLSNMKSKKTLNEAFENILVQDPELQRDPVQSRAYFDVIARHAPSLAIDPLVAPQLIKQFDSFGGVDVQTVKNLREIESEGMGRVTRQSGYFESGLNTLNTLSGLGKGLSEHTDSALKLRNLKHESDMLDLRSKLKMKN